MTRRPAAAQQAYVLHSYDWSESSLILDLFTRQQGRVAVAAKGAKRPYSQLRPVLLPFQRLTVSFGRALADESAEVQTLRQAEWSGGSPMLSGAALFSGFYLNELLMKLLPRQDAHPALFETYAETLPALAAGGDSEQAALRAFELALLRELGLLPDLSVATLSGEPLAPQGRYALRPETGVGAATGPDDASATGSAFVLLEAALQHGSVAALQARCLPVLGSLRPMLRTLLHYHLGTPQLRTRQVVLDLQRLLDGPLSPR